VLKVNQEEQEYYVGYNGEAYIQPDVKTKVLHIQALIDNKLECNATVDLQQYEQSQHTELDLGVLTGL
jgi:hypothetical protein